MELTHIIKYLNFTEEKITHDESSYTIIYTKKLFDSFYLKIEYLYDNNELLIFCYYTNNDSNKTTLTKQPYITADKKLITILENEFPAEMRKYKIEQLLNNTTNE